MSPGATAGELAVTLTTGGRRSGREWKCCSEAAVPGWIGSGVELIASARATPNTSEIACQAPPTRAFARTVTRSPSTNG